MNQKKALEEKSNDYSQLEEKYFKANQVELLDPFPPPVKSASAKELTVTIVIPARNVEPSILSCLTSIEQSSFNIKYPRKLQVVVVDDGSSDRTWDLVKNSHLSLNLIALRQDHHGQAQALNTGIAVGNNDIIICCDADMVLSYYAIEQFISRHEQFSDVLLVGFRSATPANDPRVGMDFIRENGVHRYPQFHNDERIVFPEPGYPSNMCLTSNHFKNLGNLNGLWMRDEEPWLLPDLVFGALFSLSRQTYIDIGGYDERFVGWGCTDGYLASKAISIGNYVIPVYSASALHISHPDRSLTKQSEYKKNRKLFLELIRTTDIKTHPNFLAKAKNRIRESLTINSIETTVNFNQERQKKLEPRYLIVDTLLAIGEYQKVIDLISKKQTSDDDFLLRLARASFGTGKYSEAINILKKLSLQIPETAIELAVAQSANNEFLEANKTLEKFAKKGSKNKVLFDWYYHSVQKHLKQGTNYYNQCFYEVGMRCFEIVLIQEPSNKMALKYRNACIDKLKMI